MSRIIKTVVTEIINGLYVFDILRDDGSFVWEDDIDPILSRLGEDSEIKLGDRVVLEETAPRQYVIVSVKSPEPDV